jgi:hypothetical protein
VAAEQPAQRELIDRLMFAQANEAARCLDEGVLRSVADGNIGSIFGWGFAPFQGGALQFINAMGAKAFVARARELAAPTAAFRAGGQPGEAGGATRPWSDAMRGWHAAHDSLRCALLARRGRPARRAGRADRRRHERRKRHSHLPRRADGLWSRFDPAQLASEEGFRANPARVWQWYAERRRACWRAQPNAGHRRWPTSSAAAPRRADAGDAERGRPAPARRQQRRPALARRHPAGPLAGPLPARGAWQLLRPGWALDTRAAAVRRMRQPGAPRRGVVRREPATAAC